MNFLRKGEINLVTAVITCVISVLGFAISAFLLTQNMIDIPLGFLFSGGVIGSLYLLTHFLVKIDKTEARATWSILAISIRLFIIVGVMIIIALMYYRWNLKYFNIFVFVGIYTISALTFVLSHLSKNRKE